MDVFLQASTFSNLTKWNAAPTSAGPHHASGLMIELKATPGPLGQCHCRGIEVSNILVVRSKLYPSFQSRSSGRCRHWVMKSHPDVFRTWMCWMDFHLEMYRNVSLPSIEWEHKDQEKFCSSPVSLLKIVIGTWVTQMYLGSPSPGQLRDSYTTEEFSPIACITHEKLHH